MGVPNLMRRPVKPERNHIRLRGVGFVHYRKSRAVSQDVPHADVKDVYRFRKALR
jgi:hypothetical protein